MKQRILLVDDNLLQRKIMSQLLSGFQCTITEAASGVIAIDLVKSNDFDLVLMDIVMPRMNGYEAAKEIMKIVDIPVIALVERHTEEAKQEAKKHGMVDILAKPLQKDAVKTVFDQLFGEDSSSLFDVLAFESFYDDPTFRLDIIDTVMEDKDQDILDLKTAFGSKVCDTIYKKVHYLKGSFSYLKSERMVALSQAILDACKAGKVDKALSLQESYIDTFNEFLNELTEYVKLHSNT